MGSYCKAPPWGRAYAASNRRGRLNVFAYITLSGCLQPDLVIGLPIFPWARQGNRQLEASSGRFAATFPQGEGFKQLPAGNNPWIYNNRLYDN